METTTNTVTFSIDVSVKEHFNETPNTKAIANFEGYWTYLWLLENHPEWNPKWELKMIYL